MNDDLLVLFSQTGAFLTGALCDDSVCTLDNFSSDIPAGKPRSK